MKIFDEGHEKQLTKYWATRELVGFQTQDIQLLPKVLMGKKDDLPVVLDKATTA